MTLPKLKAGCLAVVVTSLALALTPSVSAQESIVEGFEDLTPPEAPHATTASYTFSSAGTGAAVSTTAQAHSGDQSLRMTGSTFKIGFDTAGRHLCGISYWIRYSAFPNAGTVHRMGITDQPLGSPFVVANTVDEWAQFNVDSGGAVGYSFDENNGGSAGPGVAFGLTLTLNTWYNFQIGCADNGATGTLLFYEATTDTVVQVGSASFTDALDLLVFWDDGAGSVTTYIDDIDLDMEPLETGHRFCANPAEDNFGYDYVEGVTYEDGEIADIDLADAFVFTGDSGDSDYLAKGLSPGSTSFKVRARIEAGTELFESLFKIAFTTGATTLTAGSALDGNGEADHTASGNGDTTGNFANSVQVRIEESGDHWNIGFYSTVAGSQAIIPGGFNYAQNPNDPFTFELVVDSLNGPTGTGDGSVWLNEGDGDLIASRTLPAGLQGVTWKDQWFIGKGTSASTATTALDDEGGLEQLDNENSTCLYDLVGTSTVTGSSGLEDGTSVPDPDTLTAPTGLTAIVTTATTVPTTVTGTAVIDLRWRLSTDDPDQDVGAFAYGIYINGIRVSADSTTALDTAGVRYNQVSIQGTATDPYTFNVRAENGTEHSALSCTVTVDPTELADLGSCGDITGLQPPSTGAGVGGGLDGATTGGTDIGVGINGFFTQICGTSTAALFICGLVLLIVEMAAIAAVVAAFGGKGLGSGLAASIVGIPGGLGNVLLQLWAPWVGITMIVLAAGIIAAVIKKQFLGSGAAPSG